MMARAINLAVTEYWVAFYIEDHCTVCGNIGVLDTRGVRTTAGILVGRVNYCFCPNGQSIRARKVFKKVSHENSTTRTENNSHR